MTIHFAFTMSAFLQSWPRHDLRLTVLPSSAIKSGLASQNQWQTQLKREIKQLKLAPKRPAWEQKKDAQLYSHKKLISLLTYRRSFSFNTFSLSPLFEISASTAFLTGHKPSLGPPSEREKRKENEFQYFRCICHK